MKVLVVAAHFPPENSVAASRPAAWARMLRERGHEVSVLSTVKRISGPAAWSARAEGVELIEVALPGSSLARAADAASVADAAPGGHRRPPLRRLLEWLRRSRGVLASARMPDHHDVWAWRALRAIRGRRWDVVISTHGPYACHLVAWRLRRRGGAGRWLADFRDLWTDNHIFPGLPPFVPIERWLERRMCRRADALSTVSSPLAAVLSAHHARPVSVIENTVDLRDFAALDPGPAFPPDGLVRLVYTGTIYRSGQTAEPLFAALAMLRTTAPALLERVRLVFAGKFQAGIHELAREHALEDRVQILGQVPRETSLRMQRDASALVFLSFEGRAYGGILTAKLFEYLACGTEILSLGHRRDDATAALIETSRRGHDYGNDHNALAAAIVRIASAPEQEKFVDLETARRIHRSSSAATLGALVEAGAT